MTRSANPAEGRFTAPAKGADRIKRPTSQEARVKFSEQA
jgi:hypothetical protein